MPRRQTINALVLCFICLLHVGAAAQQPPADLDAWVERTMTAFEVPGIAVAIVKGSRASGSAPETTSPRPTRGAGGCRAS